jgi:hypothetical protein
MHAQIEKEVPEHSIDCMIASSYSFDMQYCKDISSASFEIDDKCPKSNSAS